jgi:L-2-hydroxycarboxylate dehydrogenase (NAD+)
MSGRGNLIPAAGIDTLIRDCMQAVGMPPADAAKVAELMLEADLVGADAHGVFRLPQYIRRIKGGAVNPKAHVTVEKTGPATAMVDGDNGMGHLVMTFASNLAVELARASGVGWVGVRRSNHSGAGSTYATMPVAHGMVGIYTAVSSSNFMAPWGGAEPLLGTNPIAVGIPAGNEPPVVLDLLGGPLNRAAFGRDVKDANSPPERESNTGHFIIALDVAKFLPLDMFKSEMDRHISDLSGSKKLPGVDEIRIPGQGRVARRTERQEKGVPLAPGLIKQVDELAKTLNITPLSARS